ncbi:MAG: hypothetical protein ACN6PJ_30380 [Achromobacter sp.]|uniref:hypothetical protein n=1 Tax=Achromobacter sp. TaxID=134375 RepID=UPI003D011397
MLNIPAGWKPISSAPKDGTEILAWRSDCGQFIASYTSADSFPMTQDELDAWDEETLFAKDWFTQWPQAYRLEGIEVPTHWMPLPAAPAAAPSPSAPGDAQDGVTVLPDGSAFALASFPLPATHWLYAEREYAPGAEEPKELPAPILTHAQRDAVVAAVRYAVRGATMCGKEPDFDPDALVQNAVYALCGPYGSAAPAAGDALPTIKGAAITGGYVVVTPAGWGEDKPQKVRDAILRLFPVNPAYTPKSETALATQQGEA